MAAASDPVAAFWAALRSPGEEERRRLVEALSEAGVAEALNLIARRVGGPVPDTVAARTAVEVVVAAAAAARAEGTRLRVLAPSSPVPGWGPLMAALDLLTREGLVTVYQAPLVPAPRLEAQRAVRKIARMLRGVSARLVDVSDSGPLVVAAAYPAGVRSLTLLVDYGYSVVFQRFGFVG